MKRIEARATLSSYKQRGFLASNYIINLKHGYSSSCIHCNEKGFKSKNFEKMKIKKEALNSLENKFSLSKKNGIILSGLTNDPYNHFERCELLTKGTLELIAKYDFGLSLITKSDLVIRDLLLLKRIQFSCPISIHFIVTTDDDEEAKIIEPNNSPASSRFMAMEELTNHGFMSGIILSPIINVNEDKEKLKSIIKKTHEVGGKWIITHSSFSYIKDKAFKRYLTEQLDKLFLELKNDYLRKNDVSKWKTKMNSKMLKVLEEECQKYEILYKYDEIEEYILNNYKVEQKTLFS